MHGMSYSPCHVLLHLISTSRGSCEKPWGFWSPLEEEYPASVPPSPLAVVVEQEGALETIHLMKADATFELNTLHLHLSLVDLGPSHH